VREFFLGSPWPGVAVWCILYVSDFVLTVTWAGLYKRAVAEKIVFEGSFELEPVLPARYRFAEFRESTLSGDTGSKRGPPSPLRANLTPSGDRARRSLARWSVRPRAVRRVGVLSRQTSKTIR
jgi:hypothetical protein